jgi:hypothetical protein
MGPMALVASVAGLLLCSGSAIAHGGDDVHLSERQIDRLVGHDAKDLGGQGTGPYAVSLNGRRYVTHGPDLQMAPDQAEGLATADSSSGLRPPACATDSAIHVLYARPAGSENRFSQVVGAIREEIERENALLSRESIASGGPSADYRVVCDSSGQIRVDTFVTSGSSFESIVSSARAAGYSDGSRNYTVFYDGGGACGIGTYISDERLTAGNHSNQGGGYAVAYHGCWSEVPMHENGHNMGAVQYNAPNSTGSGGHCRDELDVMCYSDGGSLDTGTWKRCSDYDHFDCGHDTYFDSAPEPGEYLASHWNIGSPLNRFLVFGRGAGLTRLDLGDPRARAIAAGGSFRFKLDRSGWRLFKLELPADATRLDVSVSAARCQSKCPHPLDLYLRRGALPTRVLHDCRARHRGQRARRCALARPSPDWWYIGVRGPKRRAGGLRLSASLG